MGGRLLGAPGLRAFDSLPFLSLPDSLPLGEFLNQAGFREGLLGPCRQLGPPTPPLPPGCLGSPHAASMRASGSLRLPAAGPGCPGEGQPRPRWPPGPGCLGERGPGLQGVVRVTLAHVVSSAEMVGHRKSKWQRPTAPRLYLAPRAAHSALSRAP